MKRHLLILLCVGGFSGIAYAQPSVTLLTFQSYTFPDRFRTEFGDGRVEDGFQWGGGLEIGLSEYNAIELIYQRMETDAQYQGFDGRYNGRLYVNYVMIGGTRYLPFNDRISGFGSLNAGMGIFNPSSSLESENIVKFAWGGRLGLRVAASERLSLRVHAQLMSPVQWAGGGFFLGTGGSGAGVSTGSTIFQFNLGGSVNIRLR